MKNTSPQFNTLQEYEYAKTPVLAGISPLGEMIAIRPICENLGIDRKWQQDKIKSNPSLSSTGGMVKVISSDGKLREMFCLPPASLQEWLWTLHELENINRGILEQYKKGLVIYLLMMLKISLDEVIKLRKISNAYDELVEDTKSYFDATDESLELRKQAKEISNRQKEIRKRILAKVNIDPNQLGIEFY